MNKFINSFLFSKGLIWQQIESFDFFLKSELKKIINNRKFNWLFLNSNYKLTFGSIKILNAVNLRKNFEYVVTPIECRQRDLTYSSNLYVDLKLKIFEKIFFFKNFNLCKLPMMLQSKNCILWGKSGAFLKKIRECSSDPGGYFIIKGIEKLILIQEQLILNRIFIEHDSHGCPCVITMTKNNFSTLKNLIVLKNRKLFFRNKMFIEDIPSIIIFRYLGFKNNNELIDLVGSEFENLIKYSLLENRVSGIITKEQSVSYLIKRIDERFLKKIYNSSKYISKEQVYKNKEMIFKFFDENILANMDKIPGKPQLDTKKGVFLSIMIRRLFVTINKLSPCDMKDYYGNKRMELTGDLIGILFDDLFSRVNKEFIKYINLTLGKKEKNTLVDIKRIFKSDIISTGVELAFITGNWSIKKYKIERNGIVQAISRTNQLSCLSNILKINSSCEKTRKGIGPRALNSSQWGLVCPSDTPEGESCGLVKSLTLLTHISSRENSTFVKWLIRNLGTDSVKCIDKKIQKNLNKGSTIFMDGDFMGYHQYPPKLLYTIRFLRRIGLLGKYVSIEWDIILKTVNISTDGGRLCRPFIITTFGKIGIKQKEFKMIRETGFYWKDLVRDGTIEFLDVNEENNAFIASSRDKINLRTTHLELSPLVVLGFCASTIPLCNHNQSPRNTYQCAMSKQAAGTVSFNQNHRTDTLLSILSYPQKSLVKTKTLNLMGIDKLPTGTNTYVCVMSYSGYDLEDSIILNRDSVSRGFSRTILTRKHKILCKDIDIFRKKEYFEKIENYHNEEKPSFIKNNNGILKNKQKKDTDISKPAFEKGPSNKIQHKVKHNWILNQILYTSDLSGAHFVKLLLRQTRKPEIGDKFSSRHGQKGVCGLISPQENLPFSTNGLIPDLIMNPHGFPSRMTIGKLIEIIGGKNCLLRGNFFNGTAFSGKNISEFNKILKNIGFSPDGKEFLISGLTGEPLKYEIFCGPVYYQKLKHMVKDKIHARSRGTRSCLTRQPTEGRSKDGGLRFGEMEKDCVVSFGSAELLIERLMFSSDIFTANFDYSTGLLSVDNSSRQNVKIKLPYACKLLFQELYSMNISPKLNLKNTSSFYDEL